MFHFLLYVLIAYLQISIFVAFTMFVERKLEIVVKAAAKALRAMRHWVRLFGLPSTF